jgi:hypothetical protein
MVNYPSKTEPRKFRFVKEEISHRYSEASTPQPVIYAALLHRILDQEVDYHKSGSSIPRPSRLLNILSGDCQDQAVLLNSMYEAAGLETGFLSVEKKSGSARHVLPLLKNPLSSPDTFARKLRQFYQVHFNDFNEEICYEKRNGSYWFVADPGWSRYVGDISSLSGKYVDDYGSDWNWFNDYRFQET